jgi:selenocysteine lyase/cysteine desulfurase
MNLDRRTFLGAALGGAGLIASPALRAAESPSSTPLPSFNDADPEAFWRSVRGQFPLSRELTYFNTGGLGPTSQPALTAAEETTRRLQARCEHGHNLLSGARAVVARFFAAQPEEIAFVRNASEGNSIVAAGLTLRSGDEVIFETHAHPGGSFPWLNQEKLRGITVKLFEPDTHDPQGNLARIVALMSERTRVVQVSHVTAPTGILLPVAEISRRCRERGIWFHVDGAQSAGMFPFTFAEIGCDSFTASGHKWLNGPFETGVLFVRRDRLDEVLPTLVGAYSGDLPSLPGKLQLASTAIRYEYGTRNAAAILGLAAAIRFQEQIGVDRIAKRGRQLATQVRTGLARLRGIEILTPESSLMSASMITFRSARVPFEELFGRLVREHAIRCRPVSEQNLNAVRVSTHFFNSPAECAALVSAVEKIVGA